MELRRRCLNLFWISPRVAAKPKRTHQSKWNLKGQIQLPLLTTVWPRQWRSENRSKTLFYGWIILSSDPSDRRMASCKSLLQAKVVSEWKPIVIFPVGPSHSGSSLSKTTLLVFWRHYSGLILLIGCHWWNKHHMVEQSMHHVDP